MESYIDFLMESIKVEEEWTKIMHESVKFEAKILSENMDFQLNDVLKESLKESLKENKDKTIEKARENVIKSAEILKRRLERVRNSALIKKVDVLIAKAKTAKDINIIKDIRNTIKDIRNKIKNK